MFSLVELVAFPLFVFFVIAFFGACLRLLNKKLTKVSAEQRDVLVALWQIKEAQDALRRRIDKLQGACSKVQITAKITEKLTQRAHSAANSALIGVGLLQKALAYKKPVQTSQQARANGELLKGLAMQLEDDVEWLVPTMSDQEREIWEMAKKHAPKAGN